MNQEIPVGGSFDNRKPSDIPFNKGSPQLRMASTLQQERKSVADSDKARVSARQRVAALDASRSSVDGKLSPRLLNTYNANAERRLAS
jgi:hypothetical protein